MPATRLPTVEARRDQTFPILDPEEIDRLRRFGELRSYRAGDAIERIGELGHGLTVVLAGRVAITRRDEFGRRKVIVLYGPGSFIGELAQLSGRPALIDAYAESPVDALILPPDKLRRGLGPGAEPRQPSQPPPIPPRVRLDDDLP